MEFNDVVNLQANLLQTVSGGTYGDCIREVLHKLMKTECLGQPIMKGIHGEMDLSGNKVYSLVVGEK